MTKNRAVGMLILLGIVIVTSCRPEDTNTSSALAAPVQSTTSVSQSTSDSTGHTVTAEAQALVEGAPSVAESETELLATETLAPTDIPTPVPSSTSTPEPSATVVQYPFPFNKPLPIQWEGKGFDEDKDQLFVIDKIWTGGRFSGNFHFPGEEPGEEVGNLLIGIIVEHIPEYELAKWEKIEGFGIDIGGTWIRFRESAIERGHDDDNGQYLAHINEEGEMRGLFFWNHHTFEPFHTIEYYLLEQ